MKDRDAGASFLDLLDHFGSSSQREKNSSVLEGDSGGVRVRGRGEREGEEGNETPLG